MVHSGNHACHYCEQEFKTLAGIKRTVHTDFRRFLPPGHAYRFDPIFGPIEARNPPEPRTDASIKAAGREADAFVGAKKNHPVHKTGVRQSSLALCITYHVLTWFMMSAWTTCMLPKI